MLNELTSKELPRKMLTKSLHPISFDVGFKLWRVSFQDFSRNNVLKFLNENIIIRILSSFF